METLVTLVLGGSAMSATVLAAYTVGYARGHKVTSKALEQAVEQSFAAAGSIMAIYTKSLNSAWADFIEGKPCMLCGKVHRPDEHPTTNPFEGANKHNLEVH